MIQSDGFATGGLPLHERAKLIHHPRPFWDTYRFRIARQVDDII